MKRKLIIVGSLFITLVVLQVFSSGHGHVVVVKDNVKLNGENKQLTTANKQLTHNVGQLKTANEVLVEEKQSLEEMVSEVIGDLDSTKSVVKDIKKEDIMMKMFSVRILNFQDNILKKELLKMK